MLLEESEEPSSTCYVPRACPEGEIKTVSLQPEQLERMIQLPANLSEEVEATLLDFLRENEDVFAWTPIDLQGIDRDLI